MGAKWQHAESMPKGERVLAVTGEGKVIIAKRLGPRMATSCEPGEFWIDDDAMPVQRLLWWQPLPAPPEPA